MAKVDVFAVGKDGDAKAGNLLDSGLVFETRQIEAAIAELEKTAIGFQDVPTSAVEVSAVYEKFLVSSIPDLDGKRLNLLLGAFASLATDIAQLSKIIKEEAEDPYRNAVYVHEVDERVLRMSLSEDAFYALVTSRLTSLVERQVINSFRSLKVRSAGASVASATLDLLVRLGLKDVLVVDFDKVDFGPLWRMIIDHATRNVGLPKSEVVADHLRGMNDFGTFESRVGFVIPDEDHRHTDRNDVTFEQFMDGIDPDEKAVVIEAIEGKEKVALRDYLEKNFPHVLLVMPTDVGSNPYCSVEIPGQGLKFNSQQLSEEWEAFSQFIDQLSAVDKLGKLQMVAGIVEGHFPPEHMQNFLAIAANLMPFWAQSPISVFESASFAAKAVIMYQAGWFRSIVLDLDKTPRTFWDLSAEQVDAIQGIFNQIFDWR